MSKLQIKHNVGTAGSLKLDSKGLNNTSIFIIYVSKVIYFDIKL